MAAEYEIPKETKLPRDEELIVLREMIGTMIARGICLKEHTSKATLLVFPAYFRRERPDFPKHPPVFVSYAFRGMLDEVYTTLVVRLHHTEALDKDKLYKDAADFKAPGSHLAAGLKMTRLPDSRGEITVYLDPDDPDRGQGDLHEVRQMTILTDPIARRRSSGPGITSVLTCGARVESHENVSEEAPGGQEGSSFAWNVTKKSSSFSTRSRNVSARQRSVRRPASGSGRPSSTSTARLRLRRMRRQRWHGKSAGPAQHQLIDKESSKARSR